MPNFRATRIYTGVYICNTLRTGSSKGDLLRYLWLCMLTAAKYEYGSHVPYSEERNKLEVLARNEAMEEELWVGMCAEPSQEEILSAQAKRKAEEEKKKKKREEFKSAVQARINETKQEVKGGTMRR